MIPFIIKKTGQSINPFITINHQHWKTFGIAWTGQGSCHGSSKLSGISGISIANPLESCINWSTEFRDLNLSVNSITWALNTLFSDSTPIYNCETTSVFWDNPEFWDFNSFTSFNISSMCCCFFILDLRADSRLEIIRFRFLSSMFAYFGSESDPELNCCGCCIVIRDFLSPTAGI